MNRISGYSIFLLGFLLLLACKEVNNMVPSVPSSSIDIFEEKIIAEADVYLNQDPVPITNFSQC